MPAAKSPHLDYGALRLGQSLWVTSGILEIRDDSIMLTRERILFQPRYVLARSSITRLAEEPPLFWFMFSGGLRIEHTVALYPPFLFWSRDIEVLTLQLREHGFPVSTADA